MNQTSERLDVASGSAERARVTVERQQLNDFRENLTYRRLRLTLGFQFRLGGPKDSFRKKLDRLFNRILLRALTPRLILLIIVSMLMWPFVSISYAFQQTRRMGPRIVRKTSKSLPRQFFEQLTLAFKHGLPAYTYYQYELFNEEHMRLSTGIILPFVAQAVVYPLINSSPKRSLLENKDAFHDICESLDLPVPERIWSHGRAWPALPETDLLSKPILGGHGEGIFKWTWNGDHWIGNAGEEKSADELIAWLQEKSIDDPQLLERHAANANVIADLGKGVLTTVRLVTCLDHDNLPVPVQAIIRIPTKSNVVDNIGRQGRTGGIAASVDLESGILGAARRVYRNSRRYAYHPGTGAPIKGRELPFWEDARALAVRAHGTAFPELTLIGWDIGLTDNGPVIIEGNWTPSLRSLQAASGIPTGGTPLGDLLVYHLGRLTAGFTKALIDS